MVRRPAWKPLLVATRSIMNHLVGNATYEPVGQALVEINNWSSGGQNVSIVCVGSPGGNKCRRWCREREVCRQSPLRPDESLRVGKEGLGNARYRSPTDGLGYGTSPGAGTTSRPARDG